MPDIQWHGLELNQPDWSSSYARVVAFTLAADDDWFTPEADLHVMFNMDDGAHEFAVPEVPDRRWNVFADTSRPAPEDIAGEGEERPFEGERYLVNPRSVVILTSTER
jgi:glycogen operon protein